MSHSSPCGICPRQPPRQEAQESRSSDGPRVLAKQRVLGSPRRSRSGPRRHAWSRERPAGHNGVSRERTTPLGVCHPVCHPSPQPPVPAPAPLAVLPSRVLRRLSSPGAQCGAAPALALVRRRVLLPCARRAGPPQVAWPLAGGAGGLESAIPKCRCKNAFCFSYPPVVTRVCCTYRIVARGASR